MSSVHVSGDTNTINAIVSTPGGSVWAFGEDYSSTIGEWRVLGERWNGQAWSRLNMPDRETAPAQDFLNGAAATGPSDIWAVGSSATAPNNPVQRDLIEHFDGHAWTIVDPHLSIGTQRALSGVATVAPGDVWAVGNTTYAGGPDYSPLVIRLASGDWTGVAFTLHVPGCGSFSRGSLTGVVVVGGAVYVVGSCQFENPNGPDGPQRWYIAEYSAGAWSLALEAPIGEEINAIAAAGGTVWAGGDTGVPGAQSVHGLLWHGAGTSWTRIGLPSHPVAGGIRAVAATGSLVYAAGSYTTSDYSHSYVLAFDPSTGTAQLEPIIPAESAGPIFVNALTAPASGVPWLGGLADEADGGQAILARWTGS